MMTLSFGPMLPSKVERINTDSEFCLTRASATKRTNFQFQFCLLCQVDLTALLPIVVTTITPWSQTPQASNVGPQKAWRHFPTGGRPEWAAGEWDERRR